jgi:hypothetical protein
MKNITLSAEEKLIDKARKKAKQEHTTLNAKFRQWLERYTTDENAVQEFDQLMQKLSYAEAGKIFTRDELNER